MADEMNPALEMVAITDSDNRVIGAVTRGEMRARGLTHRASYIYVFNGDGALFVQKRTLHKDIYPGWYDVATGGVVLAGESYEESARRELFEELGIEAPLTRHFDFYHEDAGNRVWGAVFSCRHNGPFFLQASEVESGAFMTMAAIAAASQVEPFTPDGLIALERLVGKQKAEVSLQG